MNVGNLCQRNVTTVTADASLSAAARLMREEHVGCLVVTEERTGVAARKVVGVLTDRDIVVAVVARDVDPRALNVGDVMTREPFIAGENSSVEVTLRYMREVGVRRVPVVNGAGHLVGILALDDALRAIAQELDDIAGSIRSEQRVERYLRN